LEGGQSVRRVVHAGGSATGRRVVRQLSALAAADARITVLERQRAGALWRADGRCGGLVCEDGEVIAAGAVVIATGGAAALWARTTNPPGSQGIGLLLAHAAGARVRDLELLQFHPTDLNARSTLAGLYAVGESSCTGLHGANRLASNSLSECFVFARRAVADALAEPASARARADPSEQELARLRSSSPPGPADRQTRE